MESLFTAGTASRLRTNKRKALSAIVREGGGLVVLHAGVSLSAHDRLFEMIGARFTGHPPYQPPAFEPVSGEAGERHPIVQDIAPFESEDEPYRYAFAEGAELAAILEYRLEGASYPAAWVRRVEAGRVVCLMPGHNANSLAHPQVRRLIRASCLWAAGRGEAALPE
nr:ThuA domain-containing protein [Paenibacillus konkukensis]